MTREEAICNAARERADRHKIVEKERANYHNQLYFYDSIYNAEIASFEVGAAWADKNPKNVWHDASEEPENGSNIVAIDKDGNWWDIQPYHRGDYEGYELEGWFCCSISYNNIQKWAYINDLLPKGGEK